MQASWGTIEIWPQEQVYVNGLLNDQLKPNTKNKIQIYIENRIITWPGGQR